MGVGVGLGDGERINGVTWASECSVVPGSQAACGQNRSRITRRLVFGAGGGELHQVGRGGRRNQGKRRNRC